MYSSMENLVMEFCIALRKDLDLVF